MGINFGIPLTPEEENDFYGNRKIPVGTCFRENDHYYLQQEHSVLHVNLDSLINSLHVGFLSDKKYREVPYEDFRKAITSVIYDLELDAFWKQENKDLKDGGL